jgi:hypothetical protein
LKTAEDNTPIVEPGERYIVDVETGKGTYEIDIINTGDGLRVLMWDPDRKLHRLLEQG